LWQHLHIIVFMHSQADFMAFMLWFLDPDFGIDSPEKAAIEWTSQWEEEQHNAYQEAKNRRDIPAMMRAAGSIRDSIYEWNPEIFIEFDKDKLRSIQQRLRAYIDEWIDTGFQSDGSECPGKRNFQPMFRGWSEGAAATRPEWNSPPEAFEPPPAAISALARLHRGKAIPFGRHFEIEIEKDTKQSVQIRIHPDGGIDYFLSKEWLGSDAELRAAQIFYWFYRSKCIFFLMRCAHCKRLDVPKTKPRRRYERGWHCDKCRNGAAALAATSAKRGQVREQWSALAVNAYREYTSKSRRATHDVSAYITERVNKHLPFADRIKRNTITRNLKAIQAKAELKGAKQNAKS
jgi:transposase-like protein